MMQDQIIPVNNEALQRALNAVVGTDTAKLIGEAYKAIDAAMAFGYTKGAEEARKSNNDYWDTQVHQETTAAFQRGFDAADASYDDGYTDGVHDARHFPEYADSEVARLIAEDEYDAEYDGGLVSDSGDETPSDGAIYAAVSARDDIRAAEGNTSDI